MIHTTHPCKRTHRSFPSLAECIWPESAWIVGAGPHAVLAHCDMLSVELYATPTEAEHRFAWLQERGCGHRCTNRHERHVLALEIGAGVGVSGRSWREAAR